MSILGLKVYSLIRWLLPASVQQLVGGSALLAPLRRCLLGNEATPHFAEGDVEWEGWNFSYNAPYKSFLKAKDNGIENRICRLARATLCPGDTAIDVGANYGFVSTVMAKSVMPNGLLIAFEIDSNIVQIVRHSMKRNGLDGVSKIIDQGAGSIAEGNVVTVDQVVQRETVGRVRFLKVDTDGSDYDVLIGAMGLLKDAHPVVVVEMSKQQQNIFDLLCRCGYE